MTTPIRILSALLLATCAMNQALAEATVFTGRQAWEMSRKSTCGTLEDTVVRYGIFEGRAYSRVPGEKDRHLFNLIGINTRQCGTVNDDERGIGYRSVSREIMMYLDPKTNEVMDEWQNPFTNETVTVVHVANDPVNMRAPNFEKNADGAPRTMSLRRYGDMLVSSSEVPLYYDNPLGSPYQNYVGGHYHAMEMFNTFYDAEEMENGKSLSISRLAWSRLAQWLPWMEMGSKPGIMVFNATGFSTFDKDQIPDTLMTVLKERYPEYLTPPPPNDPRPNETSWTVFLKYLEDK